MNPTESGAKSSAGASPAPSSTPNNSPSTPALNMGMGPKQGSSSGSSAPERMPIDQVFQEYGEDIFKHDRFKELGQFKQQWGSVEPLVKEWGGIEGLQSLNQHLGPVWKAISNLEPAKANAIWQKLYPVFTALLNNQEIDNFFGQQQNAGGQQAEEVDPTQKKLQEMEQELKQFKSQNEMTSKQAQEQKAREVAQTNYSKYENKFQEKCKGLNIPQDAWNFLGDIMTNRLIKYMPKDSRTNSPLNPLFNFDESAFDRCFEKEVATAFKLLSQAGVEGAVTHTQRGGPVVPNTHSQGATPGGIKTPESRSAKAQRLAQFFERGR